MARATAYEPPPLGCPRMTCWYETVTTSISTAMAMAIGTFQSSAPAPATASTASAASGPYATDESASEDRMGRALRTDRRSLSIASESSGRPSRASRTWTASRAAVPAGWLASSVATR